MIQPIRVRFAPSPTGRPHVGNIRTAMFNWLFARHGGGRFVLRIEDTDVARKVEGAVEAIMDGLRWLGLDWDEGPEVGGSHGPYYQSQRLERYRQASERLIAQGDAYRCYCSPERLEAMREEQVRRKQPPGYDRHCRSLSAEERAQKEAQGIVPVVRFKVPLEGQTRFHDLIYGDVVFEHTTIDDFVLLKSDGYPTYHLANVVDDHAMEISHVIRAEEWISSTPRHLLLYEALGYRPPQFIHHPMILGPDRAKLSKRHGAVSILEYRAQGYLPETMFNFLSLIGWSLDDKTEIMSRQQLIDTFSLERIGKTGAIFNREKLDWMNGIYIRSLSIDDFTQRVMPFLDKGLPPSVKRPMSHDYVRQVLPLVQERARTLFEVPELTEFFFVDELEYDARLLVDKKTTREVAIMALEKSRPRLEQLNSFTAESLETMLRALAEELGLKTGQLFGALRTAVTGRTATPPLFQTMAVLGRDTCLKRIDGALNRLRNLSA
ncbi:MAG: glutamate--tRNA ligase [Chloroflexi bacterium RBG_16_50_9]|nr:MAG: glutamate--tRNA ligase [Chloroflexi bacterium RBG_16_50_9]